MGSFGISLEHCVRRNVSLYVAVVVVVSRDWCVLFVFRCT